MVVLSSDDHQQSDAICRVVWRYLQGRAGPMKSACTRDMSYKFYKTVAMRRGRKIEPHFRQFGFKRVNLSRPKFHRNSLHYEPGTLCDAFINGCSDLHKVACCWQPCLCYLGCSRRMLGWYFLLDEQTKILTDFISGLIKSFHLAYVLRCLAQHRVVKGTGREGGGSSRGPEMRRGVWNFLFGVLLTDTYSFWNADLNLEQTNQPNMIRFAEDCLDWLRAVRTVSTVSTIS